MNQVNLARSPFLAAAYAYIQQHPKCCKKQVILGTYAGRCPNRTYAYRNGALNRLINAGLVSASIGCRGRYVLVAKAG